VARLTRHSGRPPSVAVRGLFVTGTDTGVGKSIVAAAACAALAARGTRVAAFKPAVTGLDDPPGEWPPDHELLAAQASAGQRPEDVARYRFGPPVSPHLAAERAGVAIEPTALVAAAARASAAADALIVEGVGGLMVPLRRGYLVRDLAVALGHPLVVVARPGLGTISHTLLTLEAARSAGLAVAGVVLTPWRASPTPVEASNRETLAEHGAARVTCLPPTRAESLAEGGAALPLEEWLGERGRRSRRDDRLSETRSPLQRATAA